MYPTPFSRPWLPTGRTLLLACTFAIGACATTSAPSRSRPQTVSLAEARAQLLALHERQRRAHVQRDAAMLVDLLADEVVNVQRGRVQRSDRAQNLARFERYFAAVEFLEWDDISEPIVTLSQDGTLATMAVHKRVTVKSAQDPTEPPVTTIFAWTAQFERRGDRWLITQMASTHELDPAATRLARSVAGLGAQAARESVRSVRANARGTSPRGPYEMTVASVRGGPLRFLQTSERGRFEAFADATRGVARTADGNARALDAKAISMIRGHDFQLLPLTLEERFTGWTLAGTQTVSGHRCDVLRARDDLGAPAEIYLRQDDQQLVAIVIQDPRVAGATVRMTFDRWQEVSGVRMPDQVTAIDHQGTFVIRYHEIAVNDVDTASWPSLTLPARDATGARNAPD